MLIKHQALKFHLFRYVSMRNIFSKGGDHAAAVLGEGASGKKVQAWLAQMTVWIGGIWWFWRFLMWTCGAMLCFKVDWSTNIGEHVGSLVTNISHCWWRWYQFRSNKARSIEVVRFTRSLSSSQQEQGFTRCFIRKIEGATCHSHLPTLDGWNLSLNGRAKMF